MRKRIIAAVAALTSLAAPPPRLLRRSACSTASGSAIAEASIARRRTSRRTRRCGGMFDAGYSVTCRDAALPVGKLYKLRDPQDAARALEAIRGAAVDCSAPHKDNVPDLGAVDVFDCEIKGADVFYRAYQLVKGDIALRRRGPDRIRQRASARPQKRRQRSASSRRNLDRDDRHRRPCGLRPGAGRNARSCPRARRSLSSQQCRQLRRSRGVLRRRQQCRRRTAEPLRSARKRSAAEVQSWPLRRSDSLLSAPPSSSATIRSSPAACATIARSTSSTRASRRCAAGARQARSQGQAG